MLAAVALIAANIAGRYLFFHPLASAQEIMLFPLVGTASGAGRCAWTSSSRPWRLDGAAPREAKAYVTTIAVCVTLIVLGCRPLGTPFVIFGGIYGGVFTPTEAAGVATVYSLIVTMFIYREIGWRDPGASRCRRCS